MSENESRTVKVEGGSYIQVNGSDLAAYDYHPWQECCTTSEGWERAKRLCVQLLITAFFIILLYFSIASYKQVQSLESDVRAFKRLVTSYMQETDYQLQSQKNVIDNERQSIVDLQRCTGCVNSL